MDVSSCLDYDYRHRHLSRSNLLVLLWDIHHPLSVPNCGRCGGCLYVQRVGSSSGFISENLILTAIRGIHLLLLVLGCVDNRWSYGENGCVYLPMNER
jgi:hypothetical protein